MIPPIVLMEWQDQARDVTQQGKRAGRGTAATIIAICLVLARLASEILMCRLR
jgi:hypothetical protein